MAHSAGAHLERPQKASAPGIDWARTALNWMVPVFRWIGARIASSILPPEQAYRSSSPLSFRWRGSTQRNAGTHAVGHGAGGVLLSGSEVLNVVPPGHDGVGDLNTLGKRLLGLRSVPAGWQDFGVGDVLARRNGIAGDDDRPAGFGHQNAAASRRDAGGREEIDATSDRVVRGRKSLQQLKPLGEWSDAPVLRMILGQQQRFMRCCVGGGDLGLEGKPAGVREGGEPPHVVRGGAGQKDVRHVPWLQRGSLGEFGGEDRGGQARIDHHSEIVGLHQRRRGVACANGRRFVPQGM